MEQIQEQVNKKAPEILVMEDETSLAKGLRMILEKQGCHVDIASTGHSAMDALRRKGFDLLVADLRLPDMDGMDIIREVKEKRPETKTIVITGYPTVSSAVDAMKLGVSDYLPKPFWDEDFSRAVEKALKVKTEASPAPEVAPPATEEERLIQRSEVIRVLDRTSQDMYFWRELMETHSEVLKEYRLSNEAKAAILSGDLQWINANVGDLTRRQLMFIYKRLEREAW